MKLKKILIGGLILGMGLTSSIQLFASCHIKEKYKPNVIYTVKNSAATSSITFAESEYKQLFFNTLKDYLNIDTSKLPSDWVLNIKVEDRKTINELDEQSLVAQKAAFEKNIISEADYKAVQAQIEYHKHDIYDRVCCTLLPSNSDEWSDLEGYRIVFNSETQELLYLSIPCSKEGLKVLEDETPTKVSIQDLKNKYADLIKAHKIGGIETPKCITDQIPSTNQAGGIPVLIYQDQNNANKKVTIALDSANGNLNYIYVW